MRHQLTGNAGLFHVAWELSRRGWNVMPTARNARGADLYAAREDEGVILPIQSKALSKRAAVPLGVSLDNVRSKWWVITVGANSDAPVCYIMTLDEVQSLAARDAGKNRAYRLEAKNYAIDKYREAWDRLEG
jgi:hypothetical protein